MGWTPFHTKCLFGCLVFSGFLGGLSLFLRPVSPDDSKYIGKFVSAQCASEGCIYTFDIYEKTVLVQDDLSMSVFSTLLPPKIPSSQKVTCKTPSADPSFEDGKMVVFSSGFKPGEHNYICMPSHCGIFCFRQMSESLVYIAIRFPFICAFVLGILAMCEKRKESEEDIISV